MSVQNENAALVIAKKALELVNNSQMQVYDVPKVLESRDNVANALYLHANGGTSETIKIYAENGTSRTAGAASVQLTSAAGGVGITAKANASNAVYIHANGGTAETVKIEALQGTGTGAVTVTASAGGITLAPLATKGVTVSGIVDISGTAASGTGLVLGSSKRTGGGATGAVTLKSNSNQNCAAYLAVYVGSTPYWIPLIGSDPQTV